MMQTRIVKNILIALFALFVSALFYCEEERLDLDKGITVELAKFAKDGAWYSTGEKMVSISDKDPAFVELKFPAEWNIVKFIVFTGKVKYSNNMDGTKEVSSMYNFEILTKNKQTEYRQLRSYFENTQTKIEIKEKVAATGIKIRIKPVKTGMNQAFGSVALEIWGFKGPIPKQEKIKVKTKEDARKAFKLNEITAVEYMQFLKTLPD